MQVTFCTVLRIKTNTSLLTMRNLYLIPFLVLLSFTTFSQTNTWEKFYGTAQVEYGKDLIVTSDGSYLAVGFCGKTFANSLYVVKTDTNGLIKWTKRIENITPVSVCESGSFYYIHGTYGTQSAIIKLAENGSLIWTRFYSSALEICTSNLAIDGNGNLVGGGKYNFVKYDRNNGDVILTKSYAKGIFTYILATADNDYILGGIETPAVNVGSPSTSESNQYFVRLNQMGDTLWTYSSRVMAGRSKNCNVEEIIQVGNDFVGITAGTTTWLNYNTSEFFQLDSIGRIRRYSSTGAGYSSLRSIVRLGSEDYRGFGYYGSNANFQFYDINPSTGYLSFQSYPSAKRRDHLKTGERIIRTGINSFVGLASSSSNGHGNYDMVIMKFDTNLVTNKFTIEGNVIFDNAKNCSGTLMIPNQLVKATDDFGNNFSTSTDAFGHYKFTLTDGNYTITHSPSMYKYINCPASKSYPVTLSPATPVAINMNFYDTTFVAANQPILKINAVAGRHRPCFKSSITLSYSNNGPQNATNVPVKLTLDPLVSVTSSSHAYTKTGNTYTFIVPNIPAFSAGMISLSDSVVCQQEITGRTICATAVIAKDTVYSSDNASWDKSSVSVKGFCDQGDSVRFIIKNNGDNMSFTSTYRLYETEGLRASNSFTLNGNDSLVISVVANGAVFRLEADQHPDHPGNSRPRATVEACSKDTLLLPSGHFTSVLPDDSYYTKSEVCFVLRNSFDPNEKEVTPYGITESRFIRNTDKLKYQIDFQNTGSDTAYTIIIRDTLSPFLDINTISLEGASHPYTWDLLNNNVVQFTFEHIKLVDSLTNEPKSHGYVSFRISQKAGNTNGSVIQNKGYIYFDYNSPIVTPAVFNTVNNDTLPPIPSTPDKISFSYIDSLCEGVSTQFKVNTLASNVDYLWKKDGSLIPGETSDELIINNVAADDEGEYLVVISKGRDVKIISHQFHVKLLPQIQIYPSDIELCEGQEMNTGISALGNGLNYKWYKNSNLIANEISDSLSISSFRTIDDGTYLVEVYNTCGLIAAPPFTIKANKYPKLVTSPIVGCVGELADLSASFNDDSSTTGVVSYWSDPSLLTPVNQPQQISSEGTYYIYKMSDKGCSDTASVLLSHQICTGISNNDVIGIKVFPNPVADFLVVESEHAINGRIEIFNINGTLLFESELSSRKEINLLNLASGIYFIRISSGESSSEYTITKN
jgi:hypothetical protein